VQFHKSLCPLRREGRIHKWYINKKQGDTQQYKRIEIEENITFKYLGVTLDQELTMKPLQEQIIEKVKKSSGKLQGLKKDLTTSRQLYTPGRSTLGRPSTSPKTLLHLWKSCVLVQATQYIRYIQPNQLQDIQTQLQKSLQDTFNCHGQPANLICELGIPTLKYYRHKDLTRMHYRFRNMGSSNLVYQIFIHRMFQPRNLTQTNIEYHILESTKQIFPQWKEKTPLPEPYYMSQTLPHNREKVFARSLNKIISEL